MGFFSGTKGKWSQQSLLTPAQQKLSSQLLEANQGPGAGGSFGEATDYYRNLLSDDSSDFNAMAAPEMRRFNDQIVPDIAEQYAGMGSGNLSSSGFRNAAVGAGTDLSERLASIRAQLRQGAASGLMSAGQLGLQPTAENVYTQGQPGFLESIIPAVVSGATGFATGGPAGALAGGASALFGNRNNQQPQVSQGNQQPLQKQQTYNFPNQRLQPSTPAFNTSQYKLPNFADNAYSQFNSPLR